MNAIRSTFDWAGDLYSSWFADWLHVHFIIRTVIILLILWLIIFLAAQLFQYAVGPVLLMFYYHIFFRAYNFLFVETPHEWIYIRYHSQDKPNFAATYLRLCDKVRKNRAILAHTRYSGMIKKSKKFAINLMLISLVASTLWVSAFGLHHEYAAPALAIVDNREQAHPGTDNETHLPEPDPNENESNNEQTPIPPEYPYETHDVHQVPERYTPYAPGTINPAAWPPGANITLFLTEEASLGARLRDGPGISGNRVIEIIWDNATLTYLHFFVQDEYVSGLYWLRVRSPEGTVGYISSQLVSEG